MITCGFHTLSKRINKTYVKVSIKFNWVNIPFRGQYHSEGSFLQIKESGPEDGKVIATLYTVHCTLCTERCALYTVHCTVHCALYTVHCTLFNVNCALYTMYCSLCTVLHCTKDSRPGYRKLIAQSSISMVHSDSIWN